MFGKEERVKQKLAELLLVLFVAAYLKNLAKIIATFISKKELLKLNMTGAIVYMSGPVSDVKKINLDI